MTRDLRIEQVTIKRAIDTNPDMSFLGEYSNKAAETFIDRAKRHGYNRREKRYFNAGCGDPEYIEQDYARAEAYNRGDWHMIGIRAEARISIDKGEARKLDTLTSGGLWGVENDCDKEYLASIEQDELADLRDTLLGYGFTKQQIDKAFEEIKHD